MTGVFTLTLDTELIWGSFDHSTPAEFEHHYPDERATIDGMLRLLERYEVSATWALVGHLFLDECERDASGRAHGDMVHPRQSHVERGLVPRGPVQTDRRATRCGTASTSSTPSRTRATRRRSPATPSRTRSSATRP